jgi:hypothetical protein
MTQSFLTWRHRKIIQMITSVCLLDIHSLSVLVSLWQYFTLVFFWQLLPSVTTHIRLLPSVTTHIRLLPSVTTHIRLLPSVTTHIRLFQEFHDCHRLASPTNLIHLHVFRSSNLTLLLDSESLSCQLKLSSISSTCSLSTSLNTSKHVITSLHDNPRRLTIIPLPPNAF